MSRYNTIIGKQVFYPQIFFFLFFAENYQSLNELRLSCSVNGKCLLEIEKSYSIRTSGKPSAFDTSSLWEPGNGEEVPGINTNTIKYKQMFEQEQDYSVSVICKWEIIPLWIITYAFKTIQSKTLSARQQRSDQVEEILFISESLNLGRLSSMVIVLLFFSPETLLTCALLQFLQ